MADSLRIFSYFDGAEDFIWVLGACLVNYGGVIGAETFKSALPGERKRNRVHNKSVLPCTGDGQRYQPSEAAEPQTNIIPHMKPACDVQVTDDSAHERHESSSKESDLSSSNHKQFANTTSESTGTRVGSHWALPKAFSPSKSRGLPTEQEAFDEHEAHLRTQVQGMKVNLEDDGSIIPWSEIAGLESARISLEEFASFFMHFPHLTRNLRHRSTTGILLFGPQGTGKTLLIKSFAMKYNMSFYDVRASAIMSKYVGESEKFLKALFKEVKANAPAVLLLDECDGLLCNPSADASQSHNYRLLQNELKNEWSDLIYSRSEVIVIGATNKPHDIDMDGFGRRLSLKLHVDLPNAASCESILKGTLSRVRHCIDGSALTALGQLCHERGLSGFDIDCLVEAQLRKAIREITLSKYFHLRTWQSNDKIIVPCGQDSPGAIEGPWTRFGGPDAEKVSYRPFTTADLKFAVERARATVDYSMIERHVQFASQYGTDLD